MRRLFLSLLVAVSLLGQADFILLFPPQIRAYLALTPEQTAKIEAQNSSFSRWSARRSQRMYEVQAEIAIETAGSPLDPSALGVRYAEVEAIRREIAEREKALLAENAAVLTPAQVTKLKALEEALKLIAVGGEAQSVRLLPGYCSGREYASLILGSVPAFSIVPCPAPLTLGFAPVLP